MRLFWQKMDEVIRKIPGSEDNVIKDDINEHVEKNTIDMIKVHGCNAAMRNQEVANNLTPNKKAHSY